MWLLLMLLTSSLGSPALWADEVGSEALVGTRWAEKDAEAGQPSQVGWRALRGDIIDIEEEVEEEGIQKEEGKEKGEKGVAKKFKRQHLPASDVLESRAAKIPVEMEDDLDDQEDKNAEDTSLRQANKDIGKVDEVGNLTRQLEVVAFPVGVAIGAIGAAIWPSVFPERTTTTTTTASAVVGDVEGEEDIATTTTTTVRFLSPLSSSKTPHLIPYFVQKLNTSGFII